MRLQWLLKTSIKYTGVLQITKTKNFANFQKKNFVDFQNFQKSNFEGGKFLKIWSSINLPYRVTRDSTARSVHPCWRLLATRCLSMLSWLNIVVKVSKLLKSATLPGLTPGRLFTVTSGKISGSFSKTLNSSAYYHFQSSLVLPNWFFTQHFW